MSPMLEEDYRPNPFSWETGYHYTSWSNWLSIQKEGLKPTRLSDDKIQAIHDLVSPKWDGKAVWVWAQQLDPVEHMGSILYQLSQRGEHEIVWLEVRYQFAHLLPPLPSTDGTRIALRHNGAIGQYRHHLGTRSYLVVKTIPPKCIRLMRRFNLVDLLKVD